jgi:capsular polysaccharide biosynthesis protein
LFNNRDSSRHKIVRAFNYEEGPPPYCTERFTIFEPKIVPGLKPLFWGGALPDQGKLLEDFYHGHLFPPEIRLDIWNSITVAGAGLMFSTDEKIFYGAVPLGGGTEQLMAKWTKLKFSRLDHKHYEVEWPPTESQLDCGILIARAAPGNYHHVLMDIVPRLFVLAQAARLPEVKEKFPEIASAPIIINADTPDWAIEMIGAVGIPKERLHRIPDSGSIHIGRLAVPHVMNNFAHWVATELPLLYRELYGWAKARSPNVNYGPRVFSLRSEITTDRRRIHNIQEVETDLIKRGYVALETGTMKWSEQIIAFHEADRIVASMGSNVSNMIFSKSGARVLVIHPSDSKYSLNVGMAAAGGQEIGYLWAECFSNSLRGEHVEMYVERLGLTRALDVLEA